MLWMPSLAFSLVSGRGVLSLAHRALLPSPDTGLDQLLAEGLGDGVDGELGPGVGSPKRPALTPGHAANVDEVSRALLFHHLYRRVSRIEKPQRVGVGPKRQNAMNCTFVLC